MLFYAPGIVQGAFDLLQQRHDRVEEKRETDRPQHSCIHIADKAQHLIADLRAARAHGLEEITQNRLHLILHPECLKHRETDREQRQIVLKLASPRLAKTDRQDYL